MNTDRNTEALKLAEDVQANSRRALRALEQFGDTLDELLISTLKLREHVGDHGDQYDGDGNLAAVTALLGASTNIHQLPATVELMRAQSTETAMTACGLTVDEHGQVVKAEPATTENTDPEGN